ncbi:uncharacterized protein LOC124701932 isoform X2 [Lolium rigidum]|uniref:uncharacterized protein LOC124701932 isoform X2 n=1 Tax=Lolium rigidum TaxID=89674 RepID=UPI001F5CE639|nr:uncharacterized protein LOC124701932 isoform X2 [Lolium rigidum]
MLDPNPQKKPGFPMMAAILVPGDIAAASGNAIQIARTGGRIAGSLERSLGLIQEGGNSRDCQFFLHVFGRLMTEKWVSFNEKVDEATFHCLKKRGYKSTRYNFNTKQQRYPTSKSGKLTVSQQNKKRRKEACNVLK